MTTTVAEDHPFVLGPQPRAMRFHQATLVEGGLLDLGGRPNQEFLAVGSKISAHLSEWLRPCKFFFDRLYAGFVVNPAPNAFAVRDGEDLFIGINSGLVWLMHEVFFTLFSHPNFLPDLGGQADANVPFEHLEAGFSTHAGLASVPGGLVSRSHPPTFNDVRDSLAFTTAQMAIEFTFYHELGHLVCGHPGFPGTRVGLEQFHELSTRGDRADLSGAEVAQALEYDADCFAVQVALANHLMGQYFHVPEQAIQGYPTDLELSYYCWALAVSALFRIFAQHKPAIADSEATDHPHPLLRSLLITVTVATSTAIKEHPFRERIIELCAAAPRDLAYHWRDFRIPGHQYDPVLNPALFESARAAGHSAALALDQTAHARDYRMERSVHDTLTRGARLDARLLPRPIAIRGLTWA